MVRKNAPLRKDFFFPLQSRPNFVITKAVSKPKFQISCESNGSKAVIRITGPISDYSSNSAVNFKAQVDAAIAAGNVNADIYLNTPGGDVFEANEIRNEIARFTGKKTAVLGALCASAGTYIASECDEVIAKTNTMYMIHKPSMGICGTADEIEAAIVSLRDLQDLYAKSYAKKTGMAVAKIESMWTNDCWMNADRAKKLGFVNEVQGEAAEVTTEDVTAYSQMFAELGYKKAPKIAATATNTTDNQQIMKDKILLVLASVAGLSITASSSDAEIVNAIDALKVKALKADALATELTSLKKTAKDAQIKAVLDEADRNRQITPAEREYYAEQLENNFEKTKAHIQSKPKLAPFTATANTGGAVTGDRSKWSYTDWMEKDPKGLSQMATTDEASYDKLFEAHYGKQ